MKQLTVIAFAKRPEVAPSNDMDGVMEMTDIMGSNVLKGNPLDLDILSPEDDNDFVNASGAIRRGIQQSRTAAQKRKAVRQNSKAAKRVSTGQAKVLSAQAKTQRADAKKLQGKAQIEAAKSAAQTNLNLPPEQTVVEQKGSGKTTTIVLVVLGVGIAVGAIIFAVKKLKKK